MSNTIYIVYKTTNLVNGKYYIGCHSTNNIDDGYLGSGKLLKRAIKKYGKKSFTREILHILPSKEEMLLKEKELVNQDFIINENNYNLMTGGEASYGYGYSYSHTLEAKQSISNSLKRHTRTKEHIKNNVESRRDGKGWIVSEAQKKKISNTKLNMNIKMSDETKEKIRQFQTGRTLVKHTCPHCNKSGGGNVMYRYHFNNCKDKI